MVTVVLIRKRVQPLDRGIDGFPPQVEAPVDERSIVPVKVGVFDNDCPSTDSLFAPVAGQ